MKQSWMNQMGIPQKKGRMKNLMMTQNTKKRMEVTVSQTVRITHGVLYNTREMSLVSYYYYYIVSVNDILLLRCQLSNKSVTSCKASGNPLWYLVSGCYLLSFDRL